MRPDLMGASGFKLAFNQGYIAETLNNSIMCDGRFAIFTSGVNIHYTPVFGAAAYMALNGSFVVFQVSPNQCHIFTFNGMLKEIPCQPGLSQFIFSHQQNS